jgi:hypothetical protein
MFRNHPTRVSSIRDFIDNERSAPIKLLPCSKKGWGVYATDIIKGGRLGLVIDGEQNEELSASTDLHKFGPLMNHARGCRKVNTEVRLLNGHNSAAVVVYFVAKCDIQTGDEILWNYGEKRHDVMQANPWLRNSSMYNDDDE